MTMIEHATQNQEQRRRNRLDPELVLKEMLVDKKSYDLAGTELQVTGSVTQTEAEFIADLIKRRKLCNCVETGVAYGVSTVAICRALAELEIAGTRCKHIGIDPCQYLEFNGAAIAALQRCGLDQYFELMEGPSHLMLPKLLERELKVDMVFVDGWHTFDYTMIDVFLADKLLRPGGVLMMHDLPMPSKRKVRGYLRTHRRYRELPGPLQRPLWRRSLTFGRQSMCGRPLAGLAYLTQQNMFVAEKTENFEPPHDFFARF